jgi:hypothetical protein
VNDGGAERSRLFSSIVLRYVCARFRRGSGGGGSLDRQREGTRLGLAAWPPASGLPLTVGRLWPPGRPCAGNQIPHDAAAGRAGHPHGSLRHLDNACPPGCAETASPVVPGACNTPWIKEQRGRLPPARHHRICETLPRPVRKLLHLRYVLAAGRRHYRQDGPSKRLWPPSLRLAGPPACRHAPRTLALCLPPMITTMYGLKPMHSFMLC